MMTIAEINQALTKTHPKLYAMSSEEGKQLQPGTRVFIGDVYQLHQWLIEASVIKVDARGIVKTSHGINFSTSSRDCTSTQKVTDAVGGASYRSLFLAEEVEKAVDNAIKRDAAHKLKKLHQELLEKVTRLDPTNDQELIAELLTKF